jgi:protein TonB
MSLHVAERRPLGALGRMSVVAGMHVAVFYVIARSMGLVHVMPEQPPAIEATLEHPQVPDELPPPPEPDFKPQRFEEQLTPPIANFPLDDTRDVITTEPPPTPRTGDETGSAVPQPVISGARPDPRRPLSQPPYNVADIRDGNEGSTDVELYVLADGKVGDVRIVRSSGYPRLDQATIDEAKRKWRLLPATRDGQAIPQWYRLRVVFKLNRQ